MTTSPITLARRSLLAMSLAAAGIVAVATPVSSHAATPAAVKTQVPGYYRMALGDFEVTALYDGYIELDSKLFKNATAAEIRKLQAHAFVGKSGMQTAVNGYLINTGSNLVLVDTGSAKCFGPTLGALADNLKAAGYDAAQIDTVVITHLHPDHTCGLISADGKLAFPNATLRTDKAESDFWMSEQIAATAPKDAQGFFKQARESVQPYITAGKFKPFTGAETIAPGITAVPTPGHTPGHTSYQVSSKDQNLLILGDIIHSYALQFPRPGIAIAFDNDNSKAIAIRKKLFADAAKNQTLLAGAHLPFPGIGQVHTEGAGYEWVPVQYAPFGIGR